MADLADLSFRVDSRPLRTASSDLRRFGDEGQRTGRATDRITSGFGRATGAARGLGGALATIGVGLSLSSVIQTLGGFEQSMAKVQAISGATDEQFQALRETAKSLGTTTEFTASQAADAMGFLSMAGFSAAETLEAIPTVLDLATASGMDLARTADIASNVLSGFQLEVAETARVADVLAKSASISNTNVEQMGNAMSYAAPVAAALGISIEEAASAVGVLSDAGIQGERAGTSLRTALSQLGAPSKDAVAALTRLGLTADDVNPAMNSMSDIFASLRDAGVELADATDLVGIEAASSLLVLTSGAAKYDEYTGKLRGATGASQDMAATMRDNLNGAIQSFGSSIEGLIIALGDAGLTDVLRSVIDTGTEFVRILTGMENLGEIAAIAGTAAVALGALIFPFAAVGVAAATAAVYATTHWEDLRDRFPRVFAVLERGAEIVRAAFGAVRDALGVAVDWISAKAQAIGAALAPAVDLMRAQADRVVGVIGAAWRGDWAAAWDGVKEIATAGIDGLRTAFAALRDFEMPQIDLSGLIPEDIANLPAVDALVGKLGAVRDVLVDLADRAIAAVSTIFDGALAGFGERIEPINASLDGLMNALGPLGEALSGLGSALADLFSRTEGADDTTGRLTALGNALGVLAGILTEGLIATLTGVVGAVESLVSGITAALRGDWATAWDEAKQAPKALVGAFSGLWASISPALAELWNGIKGEIATWPGQMAALGGDIIQGLIDGFRGKIADAKAAAANIGSSIIQSAKDALGIRSPSREFRTIGNQTLDGMIAGIGDKTGDVVSQIEDMASRSVNAAEGIFESGVRGMVDYMVRGFQDGLGGLVDIFKRTLIEMAATAATNKIMIGLGFGGSGLGAMGGGIASGLGSVMGGIGSTLGAMGSTFMSNFGTMLMGGADMAGFMSTMAGATSSLSGLAAAAGALAAPVAVAVAAFTFFRKSSKKLDEGIRLTTDGMTTAVEQFERIRKTQFWGLKTDTDNYYSAADSEIANPLTSAVRQMQSGVMEATSALGVGIGAFADFSHQIKLSTKGMTDEQAVKALQDELADLGDAFAGMVPGVKSLAVEGESLVDALTRTATSLTTVNAAFKTLGFDQLDASLQGGQLANRLAEMSGGIQGFAQATEFYFQNFVKLPDRIKALSRQFEAAIATLNITAPTTQGQFTRKVDNLMAGGRVEDATALINLAPLFSELQKLQSEMDATATATEEVTRTIDASAARLRESQSLQSELLRAQGRTNEIRRRELEALDPSNRALQQRIYALTDEAARTAELERVQSAAADKAAQVAQERSNLVGVLLQLEGDTAALRWREIKALEPANRALQWRIFELVAEAVAAERAAAVAQERAGLERSLLDVLGNTSAIRALELAALDPSNRALQQRIYALHDEAAASDRAAAITEERLGIQRQLWALEGNTAALQRDQLAGLAPSNRALQRNVWAFERQAEAADRASAAQEAAADRARAIADEAMSLQRQIWQLEGNTAALRKDQLASLEPANRSLQRNIWALEAQTAAAERSTVATDRAREAQRAALQAANDQARAIVDERRGLEEQLWGLMGSEGLLRRRELASLDASNRELQKRIWRIADEQAAVEKANAVADERLGLQRQVWEAEGNVVAIRRDILSQLDPTNRALQRHLWTLEKQAEAAQRASAIADERTSLEDRLLQLQGNTAEIRRRELAGLDATNRSLQLMIYGLEDAANAMEDLDPAAFATKLDYERARARAVSGVGGVTSTGMPLAVVPQTGPQSLEWATVNELRAIRKELADLRSENSQLQRNGNADLRKLRTIEERREAPTQAKA